MPGALVVSLDFELYWGVRDVVSLSSYRDALLGVRDAIPAILSAFARRDVHATWATVGMLLCRDKRELLELAPARRPRYEDPRLDPYRLEDVGTDERDDPFHFGRSLAQRILDTPGQELGTHTFSHFYCLEAGQTVEDFEADLDAASRIAERMKVTLRSVVFPRNQVNVAYFPALLRRGIGVFRSNGTHWAYRAATFPEPLAKRATRLADAYLPISGPRVGEATRDGSGMIDVPASMLLRPWSRRLRHAEPLRLRRITSAMRRAARDGGLFHLWWHPHNFGRNLRENLAALDAVLTVFESLRESHGMSSLTMAEAAARAS
jgi:peptidoglycan/xylan/chitin deacetylase (PgdA/CDA1 family)